MKLTTKMFISMTESFVSKFNEQDGVPSIQSAWENITENACRNGFEESKDMYETGLMTCLGNDEPLSYVDLFLYLKNVRDLSFEKFYQVSGIRD